MKMWMLYLASLFIIIFIISNTYANAKIIVVPTGRASDCIASIVANVTTHVTPGSKVSVPIQVNLIGNQECRNKIFVISFCIWSASNPLPASISPFYIFTRTYNIPIPGYDTPNCGYIYIVHPGVTTQYRDVITVISPHPNQKVTIDGKVITNWNPSGVARGVFTISNGFYYNGTAYNINGNPVGKYTVYSSYYVNIYINPVVSFFVSNPILWILVIIIGLLIYYKFRREFEGATITTFGVLMLLYPYLSNAINGIVSSIANVASTVQPSFYSTKVVANIIDQNTLDNFYIDNTNAYRSYISPLDYSWFCKNNLLLETSGDKYWTSITSNGIFAFWTIKRVAYHYGSNGFFGLGSWHCGVTKIRDIVSVITLPSGSNIYPVHCMVFEVAIPINLYQLISNVKSTSELEKILDRYIVDKGSLKPSFNKYTNSWYIKGIENEFSVENVPEECTYNLNGHKVLSDSCKYYTIVACDYKKVIPYTNTTPEYLYTKELSNATYGKIVSISQKDYSNATASQHSTNYLLFAVTTSLILGSILTTKRRLKA